MPRTSHLNSGFMLLEKPSPEKIRLRSNWACNVFFPRMRESHAFFGRAEYEIVQINGDWLIQKKKTILQNDYIPTMLDVYCI
jgi:3-phenylpropionate/cinnamic acid dioxygenase small subunit